MNASTVATKQHQEIGKQVSAFFDRNPSYKHLSPHMKSQILQDTTKVIAAMAESKRPHNGDPYRVEALEDAPVGKVIGDAGTLLKKGGAGKFGDSIAVGVTQAARMVKEIDFPAFVANLIEGTFHAIVKSSIEQMRAYAEMVKSVSASLNEFKDKNTTDNEARDHLVSRYPQHLQITIVDNQPKVVQKPEADPDTMPDFGKDFGLNESITDLDDETIENKLVPASRDDLARGRQQLLATIILMGINRIIVTDGKINAKIRFTFSANEKSNTTAHAFDYANMGQIKADQGTTDESGASSQGYWARSTGDNYVSKITTQSTTMPDVRVTSEVNNTSDAAIQASGQIMGEVSVNFKSESFPLEKMVDTDQMMRLQQAQGAGRGAPPPPAPGATPASSGAGTPPAAAAHP